MKLGNSGARRSQRNSARSRGPAWITLREDRRAFVREALSAAVDELDLPGSGKVAYLERLKDLFPTLGARSPGRPSTQSGRDTTFETRDFGRSASELGPEELVGRLVELASSMHEDDILKYGKRLRSVGFFDGMTSGVPGTILPFSTMDQVTPPGDPREEQQLAAVIEKFRSKLDTSEPIHLLRSLKLLYLALDRFRELEELAENIWARISPNSRAPGVGDGEGDVFGAVADYLTAEPRTSTRETGRRLVSSEKLLASYFWGMGKAIESFTTLIFNRSSVESIMSIVAQEEGAAEPRKVGNLEKKCWKKYTKIMQNTPTAAVLEEQFLDLLSREVSRAIMNGST